MTPPILIIDVILNSENHVHDKLLAPETFSKKKVVTYPTDTISSKFDSI